MPAQDERRLAFADATIEYGAARTGGPERDDARCLNGTIAIGAWCNNDRGLGIADRADRVVEPPLAIPGFGNYKWRVALREQGCAKCGKCRQGKDRFHRHTPAENAAPCLCLRFASTSIDG